MVVGIAILVVAFLVAHDLERTVGNHLVGIHIDRSACTALHHVDGEVVVELTVDDFAACLSDGSRNLVVDNTKRMVRLYGSQFHVGNGNNEVGIHRHRLARDVVVVDTTLCLYAVVCFCWNFEFT